MSIPLLVTKISQPPAPARLVHRHTLHERLAGWRDYRLILLSAPPGFGKTTLLCQWLKGIREQAAWLTLDEGDNDPLLFIQYLIAALQTSRPGAAQAALAMVQSPAPDPLEVFIPAIMGLVINEIAADPQHLIFVLDDFHTLSSPYVYQAVTYLLEHMPTNLHLVIATRADPPAPLALLRGRRQLLELRAPELRFSDQEADEFLRRIMGLGIRLEEARLLEERTEGWIAGLQLAGLALQGREDISRFVQDISASSHYVLDYLFEEVLNRQTAAIQAFLLKTSILERLTGPLCDALMEQEDSQRLLEELEHANLFLLPLDPGREWFRYHRLFADLLQHQLNRLHPETLPLLHRRAAGWLEAHTHYSEAVSHWIKASEYEQAARLVREQGFPMLENGQLMLVLAWMEQLPQPSVLADPWLCVIHGWALLLTGQVQRASIRIQDAEKALPADRDTDNNSFNPILGNIDALRVYLAMMSGQTENLLPLAQRSLQRLPDEDISIRSILSFILGGAYLLAGSTDQACLSFAQAYRQGKAAGNIHIAFPALRAETGLLIAKGQLHLAYERCQDALEGVTFHRRQALPVSAGIYHTLGELAYEWNDLDRAAKYLETGLVLSQEWGHADGLLVSLVDLSRLKTAQGDAHAARGWLTQAEEVARTRRLTPGTDSVLVAWQFQSYLANQNRSAADALVIERRLSPEGEIKTTNLREWLAYAHYLIASEQWQAARTVLQRMAQMMEAQGRSGDLVSTLACQAVLEQRWGRQTQAAQAMERAMSLAQPEGYVRTFIDEGQPLRQCLSEVSQAALRSYRDQLLKAFPQTGQPALRSSSELIEPLTERELELLSLIASGLTNDEIANQLVISLGTVKAHTSNIYRKLDVRGRTQAIARARELSLL